MSLVINLDSARYYSGLGDLVTWAWLTAPAREQGTPLVIHRRRDLELMTMLGLEVSDQPGGMNLDHVYQRELTDHGRRPRLSYLQEALGIAGNWQRPTVNITAEAHEWATETLKDRAKPVVLLFPQSVWKTREWPANYWVELSWKLKANGYAVMLMYQGDDSRFNNTPLYFWNTPIPRVAALMQQAQLVIGNDSFPAHLAGTIGVPTLALMGPTKPTVFAHMEDVRCLTSTLDCTGCHFQAPFRAACDQGCLSLYRLFPEMVLHQANEVLRSAAR